MTKEAIEALEPFALHVTWQEGSDSTSADLDGHSLTVGDFRRAAAALTSLKKAEGGEAFQHRVKPWMLACFGEEISRDGIERNHRFLEEALELVQSLGCTASEAHQLVDYVFGRDIGQPHQEAGGVMVTLAALCLAHGLDMDKAGEDELTRIWTKVKQIRAKQAAKPAHSPLPGYATPSPTPSGTRQGEADNLLERFESAVRVNENMQGNPPHDIARCLSDIRCREVRQEMRDTLSQPCGCCEALEAVKAGARLPDGVGFRSKRVTIPSAAYHQVCVALSRCKAPE